MTIAKKTTVLDYCYQNSCIASSITEIILRGDERFFIRVTTCVEELEMSVKKILTIADQIWGYISVSVFIRLLQALYCPLIKGVFLLSDFF